MKNLLLSLLLILLPILASADPVEIDGIWYNLVAKAKVAEVTQNPNKYTGDIDIPASVTYNDIKYSVTSIGSSAFYSKYSSITSITIPNSVISIGDEAFLLCDKLTAITIPNSVISIGKDAFGYCKGLTSITIPNSVTSIDNEAFEGCSHLTSVTIGNSVSFIGRNAFYDCSRLTSVNITDINAWCGITFTNFSSNPLSTAHNIYLNGEEIKILVIPNSVTSIGSYTFYSCSGLTSVTIPNSVTSIGEGVFSGCSGLTSVTIPNSVTSIGNSAFIKLKVLNL